MSDRERRDWSGKIDAIATPEALEKRIGKGWTRTLTGGGSAGLLMVALMYGPAALKDTRAALCPDAAYAREQHEECKKSRKFAWQQRRQCGDELDACEDELLETRRTCR